MEKYTRERLLQEYAEGKRDFSKIDLSGVDLHGVDLRNAKLYYAKLYYAKLCGTDLRGADLCGANLCSANLRYAIGNMQEIKSMQLDKYMITYTSEVMAISCKQHTIEEWKNFSDDEISQMDESALDWWKKWKQDILSIVDKSFKE